MSSPAPPTIASHRPTVVRIEQNMQHLAETLENIQAEYEEEIIASLKSVEEIVDFMLD